MRVALRGRQAGVAQKLLDGAQIRPGFEHVRGEAVPQRVRARFLPQTQLFPVGF